MAKPRRATEKQIPADSILSYSADKIEVVYEDVLDADGRFSRLGEHAGKRAALIILK